MNKTVRLRIQNEDALPGSWERNVILRNKDMARLLSVSPSNKYMTCQFKDVVACFSIHAAGEEEYTCSFVGLAANPYEWGGYHETLWYEEYGFLKVLFWEIITNDSTTSRIYFDKALYYAQKERLNGEK